MEIGTRLQRHLGEPETLDPKQYCVVELEVMSGVAKLVHLRCPKCGGRDVLRAPYSVLPHTGIVTPRWRCETATCGFAERLTLESWEPT